MLDPARVVQDIEKIIKDDCNAMVFPLRPWTTAKIEEALVEFGNDRYEAGRDSGLQARAEVGGYADYRTVDSD